MKAEKSVQWVSIPFKRESRSKVPVGVNAQAEYGASKFQFPSNGKADPKEIMKNLNLNMALMLRFNSLQTGKQIQRAPILSPVGPWLRTPKTIRELRGAIFERNFSSKIPQTHVCIELYAIFWAKRLRSQVTPMFLGDFCCVRTRSVHRVCGICLKYTRNPEKCQTDISQ